MPNTYLSDTDVWICVCSARLEELDRREGLRHLHGANYGNVALGLLRDDGYRSLDPALAAEVCLHATEAPAE